MVICERPLLTDIYNSIEDFIPEKDSAYIFGSLGEIRGQHSQEWKNRASNVQFVDITEQDLTTFRVKINNGLDIISLRNNNQMAKMFNNILFNTIYINITGLEHQVWAQLLRIALSINKCIKVVYVEPEDYKPAKISSDGEIYDLSEQIRGISPIPGFISLIDKDDTDVCLIPLLGFEGTRFQYITEQVQPPKIIPIIGTPGFRPDYPFHTYWSNKKSLMENGTWRNIRYAIANCPFSLFYTLKDIAEKYPKDFLKIALIGTKPHALGAILYKLANPNRTEIIYDYPIRKNNRTMGMAHLLVYHVSSLCLNTTL